MAKALSNHPHERVLATVAAGAGFGAVRARQRGEIGVEIRSILAH